MARKKRNQSEWTAAELALLGVKSDLAISKTIDRSLGAVRRKRVVLGIPPVFERGRTMVRWGPTELCLFRYGYSDKETAKITCRTLEEIKAKRKSLATS